MNAEYLRGIRRRAAQQGKQAVLIIKFPGFIMECRIRPGGWEENGE